MPWSEYTFLSNVGLILAVGYSLMKCLHRSTRERDVWLLSVYRLVIQEISWAFRYFKPNLFLTVYCCDICSRSISGAFCSAFLANLPMYALLIDDCDSPKILPNALLLAYEGCPTSVTSSPNFSLIMLSIYCSVNYFID